MDAPSKKTLVIGASLNEDRYSNMAIKKLRKFGHPVVAYGLRKGKVDDVYIDTEIKAYNDIHTVTMYISPKRQPALYDFILSQNPKRVIFNPGTENTELKKILEDKNIEVVENCTLVMLRSGLF